MAYIDWWNRTGPITMGERFGLNEISTARKTLSPIKSYIDGGRIELYAGGTVIRENGAKLVKLYNEGHSANEIARQLKYNRKSVLDAIKAINNPDIDTGTLKFKPSEDIIKLTVNKSGKNLKDPQVIERVQAIADANPTLNKEELQKRGLITRREADLKNIEFGFEGKHWSDEGRKRANKAYRDRIIKYSDPSIEKLTSGDYDVQKQHGGAKFEKVTTGNLMAMDASMNRHIVHAFEKKIDDIQKRQRANNLNRNISIKEKTKIFKSLEAEEAALRAKYPEYSKYKSIMVYEPSALSKTGFMHKEKILDPSMTFSKGVPGQDIALKNASKKEIKEIVKMSKDAFKEFKNKLSSNEIEKIGEVLGCGRKKAEGGRIGFGVGSGSMLACIDAKWEKNPKEFWKRTANIGSQGLDKLWFYAAPYWFPPVIAATGRLEAFKDPTKPEMWWDIMLASDAVKRWGLDKASLSQLKNASWATRVRIINDLLLKFPGDKILTQAAKVAKPLVIATETLSAVKGIKTELDLVKEYASKNNIPYEKAKLAYYASGAALEPRWEGDKSFKAWVFPKIAGGSTLMSLAFENRNNPEFQQIGKDVFQYIKENKPVEEKKEVTEKVELPHGTGPVDWALNMKAQMKEKEPQQHAAVDSYFMGGIASLIK